MKSATLCLLALCGLLLATSVHSAPRPFGDEVEMARQMLRQYADSLADSLSLGTVNRPYWPPQMCRLFVQTFRQMCTVRTHRERYCADFESRVLGACGKDALKKY